MSLIHALLLGIVQGLTEFFPISSSGHLKLMQYAFGFRNLDHYIVFDLICHLGTLCAIFLVYAPQIRHLFVGDKLRLKQIIVATLPLFPIVFILKPVESLFDKPQYLGFFFVVTALLLYAGIQWGRNLSQEALQKRWWQNALTVGIFQTAALLPGISRSGATISSARLLGWSSSEAVTFSFLLVIPAILGGTTLKLLQLVHSGTHLSTTLGFSEYIAGFATSFLVGYGTLLLLIKLATKQKFMYFVWYCLLLGIGTIYYFFYNP